MKLFAAIFLVVLILEEYQCEPLFRGRSRHNDREKQLDLTGDVPDNAMTRGRSEHRHGYRSGFRHRHRHTYPVISTRRHPSYGRHGLSHTPHYHLYHPRQFRTPYGPTMHRGSYRHGLHHDTPLYRKSPIIASTHQVVFYGQQGKPQSGTVYPTPLASAHQTPNEMPNSPAIGAPDSTKNTAPNGTPVVTPVDDEEVAMQQKLFSLTKSGIQETPVEPLANAE